MTTDVYRSVAAAYHQAIDRFPRNIGASLEPHAGNGTGISMVNRNGDAIIRLRGWVINQWSQTGQCVIHKYRVEPDSAIRRHIGAEKSVFAPLDNVILSVAMGFAMGGYREKGDV